MPGQIEIGKIAQGKIVLIFIKKNPEPDGLRMLRLRAVERGLNPKEAYDTLGKDPVLKDSVRNALVSEQGRLCAYCMCRIPRTDVDTSAHISPIVLEHIVPRSPVDGRDVGQGLDYNNLVAVCHGNRGPRGTRTINDLTCDARRCNTELRKVNPCVESTLSTIEYKVDGSIQSSDSDVLYDLETTLNLNYSSLIRERKSALQAVIDEMGMFLFDEALLKEYAESRLKIFLEETEEKTPFVGILVWYLRGFVR